MVREIGNKLRGLQVIGGLAFNTADAFTVITSTAVDDCATNFAATDTKLNDRASPPTTNVLGVNFSPTPTRSSQTISATSTFSTAQANFTIKAVSLHNLTGASVTASSVSLVAGIAGQSITKTSSFSLAITTATLFTDNS